jgi:hypothetical protein
MQRLPGVLCERVGLLDHVGLQRADEAPISEFSDPAHLGGAKRFS